MGGIQELSSVLWESSGIVEEVSKGLGVRQSGFDDRIGVTGLGFCWLTFSAGVAERM